MKGTSLCSSHQSCVVDLTVLMSLEAVHKAGGPQIPMSWGRQKGDCKNMLVTPFSRDPSLIANYINQPALRMAPALTALDDPGSFRTAFDRLGFSPREQAALMGAHSLGQLEVC